jgi:thymidylate kinase
VRTGGLRGKKLIAVSGVDGAGKSSLIADMVRRFGDLGIPVEVVWFRPGMGMGRLERVARAVKRLLGQPQVPAMRDIDGAPSLPSRKGLIGQVWCLLVTLTYLRRVRSQLRAAGRTIICDRHVLDAIVTLRVFYGEVNTRLPVFLVRHFLPAAALTLFLDLPVDVALARKPGDTIGPAAVTAQVLAYEREASTMDLCVLDGTLPMPRVAQHAWACVAEHALTATT